MLYNIYARIRHSGGTMKLTQRLKQIREQLDLTDHARTDLIDAQGAASRLEGSHNVLLALVEEVRPLLLRADSGEALTLAARIDTAILIAEALGLRDAPSPDGAAAQSPKPDAASTPLS